MDGVTGALSQMEIDGANVSLKDLSLKLETAEHAGPIIEKIGQCTDLQSLCLSGNTIGVAAAEAIAHALEDRPTLKRALWSDIFTGRLRSEIPKALEALGDAIIKSGAKLEELDLSDNAFGPDGVQAVTRLLTSPACSSLTTLKFHNNGLGIGGGQILAEALQDASANAKANSGQFSLKVFVAGRNRLENEGACALAGAFKELGSLEEVVLFQNGINSEGISALASAFDHNQGLQVLDLNDNTFTAVGAQAMAKVLPHLENLRVVNFDDCLLRSEGFVAVSDALKSGCPKLEELRLSFNEANASSGEALLQAVSGHQYLTVLNLNGNEFGTAGVAKIQELAEELGQIGKLGSLSDDEGDDDEDNQDSDDHDNDQAATANGAENLDDSALSINTPHDVSEGQLSSDPGLVVEGVGIKPGRPSTDGQDKKNGEELDLRIADLSLADKS